MCMYCKNSTNVNSTTTHVVNYKNCIIVIKNVPCLEFEQCGEKYSVTFDVYRFDFIIGGMKDGIMSGLLEMAKGHFFRGIIIYGNRQNLIVSHYRIKIFS